MSGLRDRYNINLPVLEIFFEHETPEGEGNWAIIGFPGAVCDEWAIVFDDNGAQYYITAEPRSVRHATAEDIEVVQQMIAAAEAATP